jgi:ribokinase
MAKIAVIGICGNSIFMYADHFHEKGETLVADSVFEEIGGKGINQAVAASRMGAEVSFLAAIGDDKDGQTCMEVAKNEGIKGCFCVKQGVRTTFAFILTDRHGENQVTGYHGAELTMEDVLEFESEIAQSDILLLQQEVPCEVNEMAVKLAKKYGVKVILNPAPIRDISDDMAETVFAVTPNEQEKQAIDMKRFRNNITTLGSKGCLVNEDTFIPAIKVKTVDTTGAGDSFNGVLAACLAEGLDIDAACRYAVIASGISVGRRYVLNAIPYREEIERKMKDDE